MRAVIHPIPLPRQPRMWRAGPGDILVFLPGEREIRETGDLLRRGLARRPYARELEILPLFARLSAQEQERVGPCPEGEQSEHEDEQAGGCVGGGMAIPSHQRSGR